jgi:hypothetical protein
MNQAELGRYRENIGRVPDNQISHFIVSDSGVSEEGIGAAEFIFWLVYRVEMDLKDLARKVMTQDREEADEEEIGRFVDDVFDELVFMGKIKLVEKNVRREDGTGKFDPLFRTLRQLNDIRNQLFHPRENIENILYRGNRISERGTKNQMIEDITIGFLGGIHDE